MSMPGFVLESLLRICLSLPELGCQQSVLFVGGLLLINIYLSLQRTQICYGSLGEVKRFEEFMLGKSERFADATVNA